MTSAHSTKLTLTILATAILMAIIAAFLVATPNGVFATLPERPTDLTATAVDHDTINLSWNHPDPATVDHYQILNRRKGSGDGQLIQIGTSTTTSFVHDGLEPEATYFYRVRPVNAEDEEGQRSPRAEATTPAEETTEPEPTPAEPRQTDGTVRSGHHVLVSNLGQSSQSRTGTTDSWSIPFTTGPDPGGYPVESAVIKYYSGGAFDMSICTADADGYPTSTCTALERPSSFTRGNLTFNAPADTELETNTTYALFLDTSNQLVTLNITGPNHDSDSAQGWSIGDAYANVHNGVWTTRGSALGIAINGSSSFTVPDAPPSVSANSIGETEIRVSWHPSATDGAAITGYKVEVSCNGTCNWTSNWTNLVRNTNYAYPRAYTHTGLSADTTRFYRVSAINSVGASPASPVVAGATTAAPHVMVSNTGRSFNPEVTLEIGDQDKTNSQGFETGRSSGQYSLESVGVYVHDQSLSAEETFNVHIYTNRGGAPDTLEYKLTSPDTYTSRTANTFAAPRGATLDANKKYHVVFEATGDSATDFVISTVATNVHDLSARIGWDIEDAYRFNGTLDRTGKSFQISVNGRPIGTTVPETWGLVPDGLSHGDEFRLLFLSSTKRKANQNGINFYDSFIQNRANAGHDDIKQYSARFRVIGCTLSNANISTGTLYTTSDKGAPIYWLNGNKVADHYKDFYDGDWDDEVNNKDESGNDGLDTSQPQNYPLTGCGHDGTQDGNRLDTDTPAIGVPNSSAPGDGPLSSDTPTDRNTNHPMYGLSPLFRVVDVEDATLANLSIEGATGSESITLSPTFDADTITYTASVPTEIDAVTLTASANDTEATIVIENDDDTGTQNEADLKLGYGDNTLTVTVTAIDTFTTQRYTITMTRAAPPATEVPLNWSLKPSGLNTGDQFRLIFLSSTRRDGTSTAIDDYNAFVQNLAAAGHTDIQAYSDEFTVVGCTSTFDARNTTATTYTSTNKGVPIYWLGGNKVADEYEDFYDGSWGDEANDKDESRNNGPDTPQEANYPLTGCVNDGTEAHTAGISSQALGTTIRVRVGRPNSSGSTHGPLSSSSNVLPGAERPMYALSGVFQVGELYSLVSDNWSLKPSGLGVGDEFRLIFLSSTKRTATSGNIGTYNTWIQARAAVGHDDIQAYSDGFTAVGCTGADDARDNTRTSYTNANKGVPIYWLNGTKVADDYEDFYDGSWDDEANPKNQSGNNGPDTSQVSNYPYTGCNPDGTERFSGTQSRALTKNTGVTAGRLNSSATNHSPFAGTTIVNPSGSKPMYGLSAIFRIVEAGDATLSDLAIETTTGGATVELTPTFDADTFTYTATVPHEIDTVTLTATTTDSNATVVITDDDDTNSKNEANLDLDVGDTILTVTVKSEQALDTETYTITVTRAAASTDATLSALTIEGTTGGETVDLTPTFDADTFTYTATVPHEIDTVTLAVTTTESNATVVITDDDDTNSKNEANLNLDVGDTTLTVTVTAQDTVTTQTYTVPVTRAAATTDATLSNLSITSPSGGKPSTLSYVFDPERIGYTAWVANRIDAVKLTATTTDSNATIVITGDDDPNTPGEAQFNLNVAANVLMVTVTAQDGLTTKTYTVNVNRTTTPPPAPTNCPADTNWCATMTVGYASQPLGETTKEEYWGYEANQTHGDLTTTTFVYGGATYTVTDLYRYKNFDSETNAVFGDYLDIITSPVLPSGTVLQVDARTFTTGPESFTGTSGTEVWDIKDNPVNWRFSQQVTVSLKLPLSMNTTLQDLTLQGSTGGEAITLSPVDGPPTLIYTASVVNRIAAVKLTATPTDSNAAVTITGDDDTNTPGEAEFDLSVGANTLTVTVTAQDGNTTQDYTITAARAAAPPAPTDCPADTTWCATLVLGYNPIPTAGFTTESFGYISSSNFGDLGSTTFSHGETIYTVSSIFRTRVTNDSDNAVQSDDITLSFSPRIPDDTVVQIDTRTFTVDADSEGISTGQETWDLRVDPPVWTASQHVTVSLKFPSNDATLINLALTDTSDDSAITLTPQFEARTESYAASVLYNTDQITIVPTTTEPNATFGFLDRNDLEIADANSSRDGSQFNLALDDNPVKIRVTAHDGFTIKTYTVVITRMDSTEPPLVTITADSPAVNYSPSDDATFTVTRASTFAETIRVNLHMTQDKLFLAAPDLARVVTIPTGLRSATLTIRGPELQLVDTDPVETGTLTATVAPGTGYVVGSPAAASVNIVPFMTVRMERMAYTVPEDVGTFAIKVIARTGNDAPQPASDFTVSLITQDGTADQGQDYDLLDTDITFRTSDF